MPNRDGPIMTPRRVVISFKETLRDLETLYDSMLAAISTSRGGVTLEGILAEKFALELGVRWEGFIHDLFIAYVLRGKRTFLRSRREAVKKSVRERYGEPWENLVLLRTPAQWTPRSIEVLLDPHGKHIAFISADKLFNRAKALLGSKAIRFSLDEEDRQLIDFVIALRNFLAHRSKASLKVFKMSVGDFTKRGPNHELAGRVGSVRAYLRKVGSSGRPRIRTAFFRMSGIADELA